MCFHFKEPNNHNKKPNPSATRGSPLFDPGTKDSQSSHWHEDPKLEQKPDAVINASKVKNQHYEIRETNDAKDATKPPFRHDARTVGAAIKESRNLHYKVPETNYTNDATKPPFKHNAVTVAAAIRESRNLNSQTGGNAVSVIESQHGKMPETNDTKDATKLPFKHNAATVAAAIREGRNVHYSTGANAPAKFHHKIPETNYTKDATEPPFKHNAVTVAAAIKESRNLNSLTDGNAASKIESQYGQIRETNDTTDDTKLSFKHNAATKKLQGEPVLLMKPNKLSHQNSSNAARRLAESFGPEADDDMFTESFIPEPMWAENRWNQSSLNDTDSFKRWAPVTSNAKPVKDITHPWFMPEQSWSHQVSNSNLVNNMNSYANYVNWKSTNADPKNTTFNFIPQSVPPLPLPPALVSANILKAQQQKSSSEGQISYSTPVKSVVASFGQQPSQVRSSSSHVGDVSSSVPVKSVAASYAEQDYQTERQPFLPDVRSSVPVKEVVVAINNGQVSLAENTEPSAYTSSDGIYANEPVQCNAGQVQTLPQSTKLSTVQSLSALPTSKTATPSSSPPPPTSNDIKPQAPAELMNPNMPPNVNAPPPPTNAKGPPPPPPPPTNAKGPPPPPPPQPQPQPPPPPPPPKAKGPPPPPPPSPNSKPPPPPPPPNGKVPPPPQPSKNGPSPPPLPPSLKGPPLPPGSGSRPLPPGKQPPVSDHENLEKLKAFHWDKVRADPTQSMVWDRIKTGSFKLKEDEFRILFNANPAKDVGRSGVAPAKKKGILDAKKAQNIAIQLRALNIATQDICDALLQGDGLKAGLLEILVKMSPTTEEQKALLVYSDDISELGPAERFLQAVLGIPNAFQRLQAMHYKACFRDELLHVQETVQTLEAACIQVRENRLFLKLLEAVLKTGNRMNKGTNRGEAEAFKLDALLKLADVKSADGKTTLLHYVTEQIIKYEGQKALQPNDEQGSSSSSSSSSSSGAEGQKLENDVKRKGLEIVIELCSELGSVKKAAEVDADALSQAVLKLANGLQSIENRLKTSFQVKAQETGTLAAEDVFASSMETFCSEAESDVVKAKEDLEKVFDKVKKATAYFHGNAKETQPLRLFVIIKDFSTMLEKVCQDLAKPLKMKIRG